MKIVFDPRKAEVNPLNHEGVTFDDAKPVLLDPYALTKEDTDAKGEQRFVSLGMGEKGRVLIILKKAVEIHVGTNLFVHSDSYV